jgi:hypothetical protein
MNTTISPSQMRTIEVARCIYCNRGFYLESNSEIAAHQGIHPEKPFKAGFVYESQNGYNLVTHRGGILSDLDFGDESTHDYRHQVATCKDPLAKKLEFEDKLKIKTVRELNGRFDQGQIWVPTLKELEGFRNRFRDYVFNEGFGVNRDVYEALREVGFLELN